MDAQELKAIIEQEGDFKEYQINGYNCYIKRHLGMKHLCGYVILEKHHRFYEVEYDDIKVDDNYAPAHGGLTYSQNNKDGLWHIGFDCAHYDDLVPTMVEYTNIATGSYKDMLFIRKNLDTLTQWLRENE